MGYSSLVDYIAISPNSSNPRKYKIEKITIHHMAGSLTVEECGEVFAPKSRQASTNYAIDNDCRVGLYVDENNRSWASANSDNDNRAVTIELANDSGSENNWHVSDAVIEKCIELCVDICTRNDIKELRFTGNVDGNLTMHKWFYATACPGPYLESKFPYIAEQVNRRLKNEEEELSVSQYEELRTTITALQEKINILEDMLASVSEYAGIRYDYVDDYMPEFARGTISKIVDRNAIEGLLQLSYDDVKVFSILDKLGIIDSTYKYKTLDEVPEYGRSIVEKLMKNGILKGDGNSLGITEQTVKILVYLDRANVINV